MKRISRQFALLFAVLISSILPVQIGSLSVGFAPGVARAAQVTCKDGTTVSFPVSGDANTACGSHGGAPTNGLNDCVNGVNQTTGRDCSAATGGSNTDPTITNTSGSCSNGVNTVTGRDCTNATGGGGETVVNDAATAQAACEASGGVELSVPLIKDQNGQPVSCIKGDAAKGGVIVVYLIIILKFLAGILGAVVILMIIIGGIQYITSVGDPGAVKAAKLRITNAITALVLFAFMYAILNFIIPGGVFG